jgi:hypothetical protein
MWNKDKQNLQCYHTKRKYHTRETRIHQENTRTPRDPPKLHFITPRKVTKWHQKSQEKMGENEREWEEILA